MNTLVLGTEGLNQHEIDLLVTLLRTSASQLTGKWRFGGPATCDALIIDSSASLNSARVDAALLSGQPLLIGYSRHLPAGKTTALQLLAPLQAKAFCDVLNIASSRLRTSRAPASAQRGVSRAAPARSDARLAAATKPAPAPRRLFNWLLKK